LFASRVKRKGCRIERRNQMQGNLVRSRFQKREKEGRYPPATGGDRALLRPYIEKERGKPPPPKGKDGLSHERQRDLLSLSKFRERKTSHLPGEKRGREGDNDSLKERVPYLPQEGRGRESFPLLFWGKRTRTYSLSSIRKDK